MSWKALTVIKEEADAEALAKMLKDSDHRIFCSLHVNGSFYGPFKSTVGPALEIDFENALVRFPEDLFSLKKNRIGIPSSASRKILEGRIQNPVQPVGRPPLRTRKASKQTTFRSTSIKLVDGFYVVSF